MLMQASFYLYTFFVLLLASQGVSAAPSEPVIPKSDFVTHSDSMTMIFYLILIIGLLIGSAFLLRRFNPHMVQHGNMQIIAAMSLGGKDRLVLVTIGDDQQLLLGVSPGRVSLIKSFDIPIILPTDKPEKMASTFKKLLDHARQKKQ